MKRNILILLVLPVVVFGHGLGQKLEQPAGDYVANLEYNRLELSAGETTTFNANLFDKSNNPVDFSQVLFEIYQEEKTLLSVFASRLANGESSVDYTFAEEGKYRAEIKFVKDGKGIAEAKFDLDVAAGKNKAAWYKNQLLTGIVGGFVLGLISVLLFRRK
ncbi:MAG: hypothetical protein WD989_01660 [Candidatus Paceibacterota bacterium]